ncbi:MAG TPA: DNA mismatch repair protein MutS [Chthoniobacterales bacterium]
MSDNLTPMMQQYQKIRASLPPQTLLFYRLGDFYEMFFEDAREAASILNVALTKRHTTPMCGVPYHSAEGYIAKLIKAGKRIAICEQTSDAQPGKIVQREVTQIISPGTVSDFNLLDSAKNNYLAAVFHDAGRYGLAVMDLSTGEFRLTQMESMSVLLDELARINPAEMLVAEAQAQMEHFSDLTNTVSVEDFLFSQEHSSFTLLDHFKTQSLDGFGVAHLPFGTAAAGAILHYLRHSLRRNVAHVSTLGSYRTDTIVALDVATQLNLELVTSRTSSKHTLLASLDRTVTPMGARRLRQWILQPICDLSELNRRQQFIGDLLEETYLLEKIRQTARDIRDIERIVSRLSQGGGNARDVLALRCSLEQIPELKQHLVALMRPELGDRDRDRLAFSLEEDLLPLPELASLLARAITDEPPLALKDGGIFREGYHPVLDELRVASTEGKNWIAALQDREIERTGIKSLKIRYTSVFGYFIEITKANVGAVPIDYVRKQTTVNGERYITPELKEMENKILGSDERMKKLEYDLFGELRTEILRHLGDLQRTAATIATLDALASLAETARLFGYCRPTLTNDGRLHISDGRHPVLDQNLVDGKFVPNDVLLDLETNRLIIITGPNMAGKSTYIRQVALLVLTAQIGSWVPAASAEIGLVDRIFTRVGANDDLSKGQSTFMVEMNETANIVNNATARSLVILDEIGRGTSTFDGLSIAWSVAEFLHDKIGARTLFATHYHEMTDLESGRSGVKNYNIAVREWNEQIIFLRKIVKGCADKSYGIQVARLAGLPPAIISRAREILANLEQAELSAGGRPKPATGTRSRRTRDDKEQIPLF